MSLLNEFGVACMISEKQRTLERQGCVFDGQEPLDRHEIDPHKMCYCGRPRKARGVMSETPKRKTDEEIRDAINQWKVRLADAKMKGYEDFSEIVEARIAILQWVLGE